MSSPHLLLGNYINGPFISTYLGIKQWLMQGVPPTLPGPFTRLQNGHTETHTGARIQMKNLTNYKCAYNHIYNKHTSLFITAHHLTTINVLAYKTQGHDHFQYEQCQWHDRWRPHASQWPKPAYHHSPLTESARPEHESIPISELTVSQNPIRDTKNERIEYLYNVLSYHPRQRRRHHHIP